MKRNMLNESHNNSSVHRIVGGSKDFNSPVWRILADTPVVGMISASSLCSLE